jgi:adenylyltransferase/sulfurtransferase
MKFWSRGKSSPTQGVGRSPGPLTAAELRRYGRHLVMPEVGREGQEKLKAARVLIVGAGGLGSPVALYLAAAGVGTLGLVEFDTVDESNLQRQVLYGQGDVGRPKLEAAVGRLREINPLIDVVPHGTRLEAGNALEIFDRYDLIVDGSDNFPTRYLVNDACVLTGKPDVFGSIFRFEGQVAVFWGARGPCYRCLFPEPPPPGLVPSCAEGGVLGVLPGIIGSLQASETIKLILGVGEPAVGRLMVFDALEMELRKIHLSKSDDCPICGPEPTQTELIDYEQFCGIDRRTEEPPAFEISVGELNERLSEESPPTLIDVRTPREYDINRIEGSRLIPLHELPRRLEELDREADLVVYCHHGPRSSQAVMFLRGKGFERARNLTGGIDAWSQVIDPSVPRY